jgi:chromosomal replication initiation ATPase DnaA
MVNTNKEGIKAVIEAAATTWGITTADILGPRRTGPIAQARQASMAICYWQGYGNLKAIATAHNRENHATVIHACNAVEADTRLDGSYKARVLIITSNL